METDVIDRVKGGFVIAGLTARFSSYHGKALMRKPKRSQRSIASIQSTLDNLDKTIYGNRSGSITFINVESITV
jgi:hypothetical protein